MLGKQHRDSDTVENQSNLHRERGELGRTKDLAWAGTEVVAARIPAGGLEVDWETWVLRLL